MDFPGKPNCSPHLLRNLGYSPQTGRAFIGTRPSAKKIANLRDEIRELTDRRWLWMEIEDRVARLNRLLLGWSNYFCLGPVSRAYRAIDRARPPPASPVALRQA